MMGDEIYVKIDCAQLHMDGSSPVSGRTVPIPGGTKYFEAEKVSAVIKDMIAWLEFLNVEYSNDREMIRELVAKAEKWIVR